MSSIKTQHTINIFDPRAIYNALNEYPASYKYIMRYVTFGASNNIECPDGSVIEVHPYSVYSILADNKQIKDVFRSDSHDHEKEFLEMDTDTGYATFEHHGSELYMCHYAHNDGLVTVLIAPHKDGYDNLMILADTIDVGESMIEANDEYSITIIPHDIGNTPIDEYKIPNSLMVSYVAHNETLDKYINYVDKVYDVDTVRELVNKYVPQVDIDYDI